MIKIPKYFFALIGIITIFLLIFFSIIGLKYFGESRISSEKTLGDSITQVPTLAMIRCERNGDIAYIGGGQSCQEYFDDFERRYLSQAPQPTLKPTVIVKANPTKDPDPLIHCQIFEKCGGGSILLKKSECEKSICCLFPDKPVFLRDKSQCIVTQSNTSNKTLAPFDCSIGDQKVKMTNMNDCYNAMNAYWASKGQPQNIVPTAPPIQPTSSVNNDAYNNLVQQHQDACNKAVAEWISFKENFTATQMDNYRSSYDAVMVLEQYRQKYQQELYSAGCTRTISL